VLRPCEAGAAAAVGFTLVSVRGGGGGEVVDGLAQAVEALLGDTAFEDTWAYIDPKGFIQGPYSVAKLQQWQKKGFFGASMPVIHCPTGIGVPIAMASALVERMMQGGEVGVVAQGLADVHMTDASMDIVMELHHARTTEQLAFARLADTAVAMEGVEAVSVQLPEYSSAATITLTAMETETCAADSSPGVFVVVDTNVLLTDYAVLEWLRIRRAGLEGSDGGGLTGSRAAVIIPWIVLCELDGLKEGKNRQGGVAGEQWTSKTAVAARDAITALNQAISKRDGFLRGQSVKDYRSAATEFKMGAGSNTRATNDDRVLQCCMHLSDREAAQDGGRRVLLLSNDRNLCNKAFVNGIDACSSFTLRTDDGASRYLAPSPPPAQPHTPTADSTTAAAAVDAHRMTATLPSPYSPQHSAAPAVHAMELCPPPPSTSHQPSQTNRPQCSVHSVDALPHRNIVPATEQAAIETSLTDIIERAAAVTVSALSPLVAQQLRAEFDELWEEVAAIAPPWNDRDAAYMLHKHWNDSRDGNNRDIREQAGSLASLLRNKRVRTRAGLDIKVVLEVVTALAALLKLLAAVPDMAAALGAPVADAVLVGCRKAKELETLCHLKVEQMKAKA